MAITRKSMEQIRREMTPERIKAEAEEIKRHPIAFDPECPPCSEEKLARFRQVSSKREQVI